MFWNKRIKKLNKKDYIEYIRNYEHLDIRATQYVNITLLFLVNIIFMFSLFISYTYLGDVYKWEILEFIGLWLILIKIQIVLVTMDMVFNMYTLIKYFVDTNRFLKRCGV